MIFGLFARNKKSPRRPYTGVDGVEWGVEVRTPGPTNALVVFHYPDANTRAFDRYAWWIVDGPQARDVTSRLDAGQVLDSLSDADLRALFRKSMPISSQIPRFQPG